MTSPTNRTLAESAVKGFIIDACEKCEGVGVLGSASTSLWRNCDRCNGTGNEKEGLNKLVLAIVALLDQKDLQRSEAVAGVVRVEKEEELCPKCAATKDLPGLVLCRAPFHKIKCEGCENGRYECPPTYPCLAAARSAAHDDAAAQSAALESSKEKV